VPNQQPRAPYCRAFPVLTKQYEELLANQQKIYELAQKERENMRYLQEESFVSLTVASTQFADQVAAAMLATQTTDQQQFQQLSVATEKLAENFRHIMTVINNFAAEKETEIPRLQKDSKTTKRELVNLRKELKKSRDKEAAHQEQ
jgi:tRNA/tmRNA/rRNA uracil-C5-methylase (TrmA/RlmC/RlmD family)